MVDVEKTFTRPVFPNVLQNFYISTITVATSGSNFQNLT